MKKIIYLIAIFTGIIAFGQQEHSGGIPLTTGFSLEDPQPIDDKYVVADSASLINLPNVYEGLTSYSMNSKRLNLLTASGWKPLAFREDLLTMTLQKVLTNSNLAFSPIWFPYSHSNLGHRFAVYPDPINNPNLSKMGQFTVKAENDGYLSVYSALFGNDNQLSTNVYYGFQPLLSLKKEYINNLPEYNGKNNTAFGWQPLKYLTKGYGNTAFGFAALRQLIEGADNTALGEAPGEGATYVDESVIVGATPAVYSDYIQSAVIYGRSAFQNTDTILYSTGIGNFLNTVEKSEYEIIISDGRPFIEGVGFWVKKAGLTTVNRQTQEQYDLDISGKAVVTKEILNNQLDDFGEDYILQSEKGANNGVATLDGGGKIPATQLPNSVMTLEGEWNASTNTPTLADGIGDAGMIYEVTTAGTQNLGSGSITFAVGDYAVYGSSGVWYKSINSNEVTSVNGQTGVVNLGINSLSDTPANFTGSANKILAVNSGATAIEYKTLSEIGAVDLSNNQTIGGVKTYLSSLVSSYQAPFTTDAAGSGNSILSGISYRTHDGDTNAPASSGTSLTIKSSGDRGFQLFHTNTANGLHVKRLHSTSGSQLWYRIWTSGDFSQTNINNWNTAYGWGNHAGLYQPLGADLTAIEALSGTGLAKRTGENTWSLDTNTYLTANQSITLSGDLSGSGTTSISATIANAAVTNAKMANMTELTLKGRKSGTGAPQDLSMSDLKDMLNLSAEYVALSGNQTIGGTKTFSNPVVVPDATLGTHAPNLEQVQEMIDASSSVVVIELDPFTLPAMSSPPNQNSFSPIDLVTATLPAGFIDWEITWTDSGYTYKASAIGDFNLQIRESGGKVQIGGQTRSDSAYSVTSGMNPKLILTYPQNNK